MQSLLKNGQLFKKVIIKHKTNHLFQLLFLFSDEKYNLFTKASFAAYSTFLFSSHTKGTRMISVTSISVSPDSAGRTDKKFLPFSNCMTPAGKV